MKARGLTGPSVKPSAAVFVLLAFIGCSDDGSSRAEPTPARAATEPSPDGLGQTVVAVVAERAGRIELLAPGRSGTLVPAGSVDVAPGPHNIAAHENALLVTHPGVGRITRIDAKTNQERSVALGAEPHDVKFSSDGARAFVADEEGRRLHVVDSGTLETLRSIVLPGQPHDLIVHEEELWVTLIGRDELARVRGDQVDLVATGMSPHDLILDRQNRIWFSNWDTPDLGLFEIDSGRTDDAPSGVEQPHHFALGPDGTMWISDNGSDAVVGFRPDGELVRIAVGREPHHLAFADERLIVAVSASGEAVVIEEDRVTGRIPLSAGLHGVAVATTD